MKIKMLITLSILVLAVLTITGSCTTTHRTQEDCLAKRNPLEFISRAMSITWNGFTQCKCIHIYDSKRILIYYIDAKGIFHSILDGMI